LTLASSLHDSAEPDRKRDCMNATAPPARLKIRYLDEIRPALIERFGYSSPMQAPKLVKITLNMGVGNARQDNKVLRAAQDQLATIAGQRPSVRRARKSIAAFKLREGMPVGVAVTLRGERAYEFLDRLISIAIPRIRDFRGLSPRSFDGRGNYSLGVREQIIFPEVDYDAIDEVRGLDITITTSAASDPEAYALLAALGMPYTRQGMPRTLQALADDGFAPVGNGGAAAPPVEPTPASDAAAHDGPDASEPVAESEAVVEEAGESATVVEEAGESATVAEEAGESEAAAEHAGESEAAAEQAGESEAAAEQAGESEIVAEKPAESEAGAEEASESEAAAEAAESETVAEEAGESEAAAEEAAESEAAAGVAEPERSAGEASEPGADGDVSEAAPASQPADELAGADTNDTEDAD
jgi:large subunit ribosomal protein L5